MTILPWKDHPALWEEFYQDQDTRRLSEWGFPSVSTTRIIFQEKPKEFQDLQGKIAAYWSEHLRTQPVARNGKMYATRGEKDFDYDRETLIVRVYEADYATLLVKLSTQEGLAPEEKEFLNTQVRFLGSSGFIKSPFRKQEGEKGDGESQAEYRYLVGQVAKRNMKRDLWESVPQGTVDYGQHQQEDPFRLTLEKELRQETGLELADIHSIVPWGINAGPKAGNCTVIYHLQLDESGRDKARCSPEHQELRWRSRQEIMDPAQRYTWNPATVKIMEKVGRGRISND